MTNRYRVTHVPHFIGGRIVLPGLGDESIITLAEGIRPGRWLEPLDVAPVAASPQFAAKHHGAGYYIVVQVADGACASRVFRKDEGDAKALAQAEADRLNAGGLPDAPDAPEDSTNLPDA